MKNLLLLSAIIFSAVFVNAQGEEPRLPLEQQAAFQKRALAKLGNAKVKQGEAWFNYFNELNQLGVDISYYYNHLFPDSTVQIEFSSGLGFVWKHTVGQVLDPTSQFFLIDAPSLNTAAEYTLDTVAIPYRYRRFQQGNADTLIVQIFADDVINKVRDPAWTVKQSYANVAYSEISRKGDSATMEIAIVLTDKDTISTQQGVLYVPINMKFGAGEKVACVVTYFPGNPYNVGDTIDWRFPNVGKRLNSILIYDGRDNNVTNDIGYFNNEIWANNGIRYGTNTNGWAGSLIPGTAYGLNGYNYHADIAFKLTFDDYTGVELVNENARFNAYPNPASDHFSFDYEFSGTDQATFELTNIVGHKVLEMPLRANKGVERVDISDIPSGLYFYTLKLNGVSMGTSRLIKTD